MIKYEKTEGGLRFTFDNSPTYLGNGTIDVPFNSVALVVDDSSMITVRKAASYDILFSATEEELGVSKEDFRNWFEANATSTGGSGGGGSVDAYTKAESDARYGTKAEQESLRNDVEQALGEIAELEADKQNKLVAGDNITIEGNVISAVGGGESVDAYVEGHTLYFGKKS